MKQLLTLIFAITTITCLSQNDCKYHHSVPDELNRGRYKPEGLNYGNPYTMFNKRKTGWSLEKDLSIIRGLILSQQDNDSGFAYGYAELYKSIFLNASTFLPAACNYDQGPECAYPSWVRDNAIVHLIGISYSRFLNVKDTFIVTPNPIHTSSGQSFADRADHGLRNLNPNIVSCWGGEDCDVLKDKAFDLIYYLQAYDLLKAAKYYPEGDGDRNDHDCSARNKLRKFSRNYYDEINRVINSNFGWKKNHGIICGSAIGMASIVLNDAGVETKWVRGLLGGFIGKGFHMPRPNYSPINWHLRADGSVEEKEAGIDDCMFHGTHWPFPDAPQTNATGDAGYAEGPDYATYMMRALLPYMRAYANFLPADKSNGKYLEDPRFTEIFTWYINILKQNGTNPTYDNSHGDPSVMGTLGMPEEWPGGGASSGDLLLAMGMESSVPESKHYKGDTYINGASGNAILRTNTPGGKYYFQFLYETGVAVDKPVNPEEGGHDDEDFGTFMLSVDNEWLAIDPPYLGSPNQTYTNNQKNHNYAVFSLEDEDLNFENPEVLLKSNSNLTLSYNQWKRRTILSDINLGRIDRNAKLFNTNGNLYYILYDHFAGESDYNLKMAINGNGSLVDNPVTFFRTTNTNSATDDPNGRVFRWNHPCSQNRGTWGLLTHTAMVDFGTPSFTPVSTGTVHGAAAGNNITLSKGFIGEREYGLHTKLEIYQPSINAVVQTLLYPYRCDTPLPLINRNENSDYVTTLLRFNTPLDTAIKANGGGAHTPAWVIDSTRDFHFARHSVGALPITNPFMVAGNTAIFATDADKAFMSLSDFNFSRVGGCAPSFVQFKQAEIDEGTTLEYDDTVYIRTTSTSTVHYKYAGKFLYEGHHYSTGSFTYVTFYLPDLQYGYQMQGKRGNTNLFTSHAYTLSTNDSFKYVTVGFPAGTTYFTIEIADPCALDCYFPPTSVTIANTFLFNTGKSEVLGHDLDIVQGAGHLNITNASRMSICPDYVLVNKDSLVMGSECTRIRQWEENEGGVRIELPSDSLHYFCNRTDLLKDRAVNHTRNTIIVNNKAGLVLDSGSVTHIGTNSTILIRAGGTLLVKAGAKVIIGDGSCESNRGELLADHDSYICIEEGANMFFYNNIDSINFYHTDTLDRHIVYIAMPDGMGKTGAIEGKNPLGGRGKFVSGSDDGVWGGGVCVPFCELIEKNPPYGVNNRPFGWFNLGLPRALYTSPDTLCIYKQFLIDGTPSLNETGYNIVICKYDTGSQTCTNTIDSIVDKGDKCLAYRYLFTPEEFGYYRVRLVVHNDCNLTDTFTKIVYVPYLPEAIFTAPDSICQGIGVLHADGALSRSNINKLVYRWTAEPFYDDSTDTSALYDANLTTQDWNFDTLTSVDSDFTFPGYMFSGGMKYRVSLMVKGWCTDSIYSKIVSVPLKVSIHLERAVSYENPIGPTPVRLKGTVISAQSWSWSPTDYLDSALSLTPVATPPEPITYVLTGTLNGCSTTDSVVIQYNQMTNAGKDRALCQDELTVLGSDFNAALLFGTYNFLSTEAFEELYASYYDPDAGFEKYFSTYLIKVQKNVYSTNELVTEFASQVEYRETAFSRPWFKDFYYAFRNEHANQESLNLFRDSLAEDGELIGLMGIDWHYHLMDDLLSGFQNYLSNHEENTTQIVWEKHNASTNLWVEHNEQEDFMNIYVQADSTQKWRITLIDDHLGLVEYDEVLLSVDSILIPSFAILYQQDSTIYFVDETVPYNSYYSYLWVFGDGDSSIAPNPVHTFTAFDSAYRVCLSITNSCGAYQFCDTVVVDSIGLNGFNKTGTSQEPKIPKKTAAKKQRIELNKAETTLDNIPNPFTGETMIFYTFHSTFIKANLRITDVLGRTIKEIPLYSSRGKVPFDASAQSAGIYYVSLIADGVIIKSKTMLVDR